MTTRIFFVACLALAAASACGQGQKQELSDSALTQEVTNRLERDTELAPFDVQVTAQDGVVTLSGRVDEEAQRNDAAKIAREAEGVEQVINRLVVRAPAPGEAPGAVGAPGPGLPPPAVPPPPEEPS